MARDLAKTGSFAVLHFAVGFGVTYALTGSATIAAGVALIEPMANTIVFFFHERLWNRSGSRRRRTDRRTDRSAPRIPAMAAAP